MSKSKGNPHEFGCHDTLAPLAQIILFLEILKISKTY
jgi:hypothetical protein